MSGRHLVRFVLAVALSAGMIACAQERSIRLADVPPGSIAAAEAAVEGLRVASARVETEGGQTVYELQGMAGGQAHEVEVTADGRVLAVEAGD